MGILTLGVCISPRGLHFSTPDSSTESEPGEGRIAFAAPTRKE